MLLAQDLAQIGHSRPLVLTSRRQRRKFNAQVSFLGERPDLLWLLARINVLQDRPQAARVFLNVLRLVPFEWKRATEALRRLEADPRLSQEAELEEIRARADEKLA